MRARVTRTWITDASGFPIVAKDGQAVQEAMIAAPGELGKVVGWKVSRRALARHVTSHTAHDE